MNSSFFRQIPEEVTNKSLAAWNKGRAWIDGAKEEVVEAYARQSEKDLDDFLLCRKEEIVEGGILFILMGGRPSSRQPGDQLGDPDSRDKHPFTTSMDQAWQDLLDEVRAPHLTETKHTYDLLVDIYVVVTTLYARSTHGLISCCLASNLQTFVHASSPCLLLQMQCNLPFLLPPAS